MGRERPPGGGVGHISRSRGGSLTPQLPCTAPLSGGRNRRHRMCVPQDEGARDRQAIEEVAVTCEGRYSNIGAPTFVIHRESWEGAKLTLGS